MPVAGAALILASGCAAPARGASYALASAPLQRAGRISYSWYLWHWPVLILAPAVIGHSLNVVENLGLVALSAVLAALTVSVVENPVRFAPRLARQPRLSLAFGGTLTLVMVVTIAVVGATLGPLRGTRPAASPAALGRAHPFARITNGTPGTPRARIVRTDPTLIAAVAAGVATPAVPSNLNPSLADAHGDKARPFLDGCNATYGVTSVEHCTYGATGSATSVVLFGDSHATQWFPALDAIANLRNWRLIVADKSTCPPLELTVYSPVLGRTYTECAEFRRSALDRIRAERPRIVILGVARHYSTDYHFTVYSDAWISGLAAMVREIRALGPQVIVMGATPKPNLPDVPSCLSAHLSDTAACTTPTANAVNARGVAAERNAVQHAGGAYIDVEPWICTPETCAVIVGNLLVYRDDNHLTTTYVTWLTPALQHALDLATAGSAHTTG